LNWGDRGRKKNENSPARLPEKKESGKVKNLTRKKKSYEKKKRAKSWVA